MIEVSVINGKKFFNVAHKPVNNAEAIMSCKNNGGTLAQPTSLSENNKILELCSEFTGAYCYIGVTRPMLESMKNETITGYTNFRSGQPERRRNEDCVAINRQGEWHDSHCHHVFNYVCQRKGKTVTNLYVMNNPDMMSVNL
ncbi:Uncharacterised protein r2_g2134 [Pycnogonum litorale]